MQFSGAHFEHNVSFFHDWTCVRRLPLVVVSVVVVDVFQIIFKLLRKKAVKSAQSPDLINLIIII